MDKISATNRACKAVDLWEDDMTSSKTVTRTVAWARSEAVKQASLKDVQVDGMGCWVAMFQSKKCRTRVNKNKGLWASKHQVRQWVTIVDCALGVNFVVVVLFNCPNKMYLSSVPILVTVDNGACMVVARVKQMPPLDVGDGCVRTIRMKKIAQLQHVPAEQ